MTRRVMVAVNNVPDYANDHPLWVVKYYSGFLWFWGAYDDENRALDVANEEDGMVVNINE